MAVRGDQHMIGAGHRERVALCRAARHGDDTGAGRFCDLDGRQTDAAACARDQNAVAEFDPGDVAQRAERHGGGRAEHAGLRKAEIVRDLDQRFGRHRDKLRIAAGDDAAVRAKRLHAVAAAAALAAGVKALGADARAGLQRRDGRAERHHSARDFVAKDFRQAVARPQRAVALDDVVIGHADRADLHQHLMRRGFGSGHSSSFRTEGSPFCRSTTAFIAQPLKAQA